jgi:hypothetical protein
VFMPPHRQNIVFFLDRYGFLILLGLLLFGGFALLEPVLALVSQVIFAVTGSG